jgi:ABC-type nitrate/sulfonate/bicarbonate transport system substrate-binding protein
MDQGWFKEVGIEIEDMTVFTPIENAAAFLSAGSADVVDAGFVQIVPSLNNIPNVRVFVYHDIFMGSALSGQPEYKTVDQFMEEGSSLDEAINSAVAQMKGKTLLLSPDPASSSYATVFLNAGGLSLSDVNTILADYKAHVPMMIANRADFENGGGPTMVQMLKNGFPRIIETKHIIAGVDPNKDISKLTSVVVNGYVALTDYMDANYDTILRIASVNFRVSDFIKNHPEEAAKIHGPYLNRYGGSQLETDDVVFLYKEIDPFSPFEEQREWYTDKNSPWYWRHNIQAFINLYEKEGILEKGKWTPESIDWTHKIWNDLEKYRKEADNLITQNEKKIIQVGGNSKAFLDAAKYHYSIFNYYDASRFAKKAVALMK